MNFIPAVLLGNFRLHYLERQLSVAYKETDWIIARMKQIWLVIRPIKIEAVLVEVKRETHLVCKWDSKWVKYVKIKYDRHCFKALLPTGSEKHWKKMLKKKSNISTREVKSYLLKWTFYKIFC